MDTTPANPRRTARATQARALGDLGLKKRKAQNDEVFGTVLAAQRNGRNGLTRSEIRVRLEQSTSRRWEGSTVSRCVSELLTAERLVQLEETRPCTVTGKTVTVVAVPEKQARLLP